MLWTMSDQPPRYDEPEDVLAHLGPVPLLIQRESVDSGLFRYKQSRKRDTDGHAIYTPCTTANMLYDHIANVGRELTDLAAEDGMSWAISQNRRATEIYYGDHIAFRTKRAKANRGGLTTSVSTSRQLAMKSKPTMDMPGQAVMAFPGWCQPMPPEGRTWLTVAFDLDDVEENVTSVKIGFETTTAFLWKVPIPEGEPDIIASLSAPLADRMNELRALRSA